MKYKTEVQTPSYLQPESEYEQDSTQQESQQPGCVIHNCLLLCMTIRAGNHHWILTIADLDIHRRETE